MVDEMDKAGLRDDKGRFKPGWKGPGRKPKKRVSEPSALDLGADLLDLVESVAREGLTSGNQDVRLKSQRIALALVGLKSKARGKTVIVDPVVMQLAQFAFKVQEGLPPVTTNKVLSDTLKGLFSGWTPPAPAPLDDNGNDGERSVPEPTRVMFPTKKQQAEDECMRQWKAEIEEAAKKR